VEQREEEKLGENFKKRAVGCALECRRKKKRLDSSRDRNGAVDLLKADSRGGARGAHVQ